MAIDQQTQLIGGDSRTADRKPTDFFSGGVCSRKVRPVDVYRFNTHVSKRYSKKQQGRVSFRVTRPCAFAELLFNSVSAPHSRSAVGEVFGPRYLRKFPGFQRFLAWLLGCLFRTPAPNQVPLLGPAPQEKPPRPGSLILERDAYMQAACQRRIARAQAVPDRQLCRQLPFGKACGQRGR